jgi:lipopolysaccharide export system permease protein
VRTLDRYVAGLYIKVWLICVVGAPLMFLIIKLTDDIDDYLSRGVTAQQVFLAFLYDFPYQMGLSFPVASLFGAVFAVALMSRNFEITAAKASGISFYRIIAPLIALGTLVSIVGLGLGELIPVTNRLRAEALGERGSRTRTMRTGFVYGADSWLARGGSTTSSSTAKERGRSIQPSGYSRRSRSG